MTMPSDSAGGSVMTERDMLRLRLKAEGSIEGWREYAGRLAEDRRALLAAVEALRAEVERLRFRFTEANTALPTFCLVPTYGDAAGQHYCMAMLPCARHGTSRAAAAVSAALRDAAGGGGR